MTQPIVGFCFAVVFFNLTISMGVHFFQFLSLYNDSKKAFFFIKKC